MDTMKQMIERQLIANVITDKCLVSNRVIFQDSWNSQDRVIRFTTPFFRRMFFVENKSHGGKWNTGDVVMYEAYNERDSFTIHCILDAANLSYKQLSMANKLAKSIGMSLPRKEMILHEWDLSPSDHDSNTLFTAFDHFLNSDLPSFEQKLLEKISSIKEGSSEIREGTPVRLVLNKYERNPKARAACIAAKGTACTVCGMEFGKVYGPAFAGKIEVHHLVPISSISKEYVVDPVKDLVPICPNCHTAIHSKPDGVYSVEELKELIQMNKTSNKGIGKRG